MRQRQIPSRERKFLCLNPGSNLSQMYWIKEKKELGEIKKDVSCVENRKGRLFYKGGAWTDYGLKRVIQCISKRGRYHHDLLQFPEIKIKFDWKSLRTPCCKWSWFIFEYYQCYLRSLSKCPCVPHHGWSGLLHTAKDESLAVFPDLILSIPQPVHQSWQN